MAAGVYLEREGAMPQSRQAPVGLGARGASLWGEVTKSYSLRSDELMVLEDACREADLVARLEAELSESELMVVGSMGQPVVNPLVAELRQHRSTFAKLAAQLKLPDEPGGSAQGDRSTSARAAAVARWSRGATG